jgi:hypothetical protein
MSLDLINFQIHSSRTRIKLLRPQAIWNSTKNPYSIHPNIHRLWKIPWSPSFVIWHWSTLIWRKDTGQIPSFSWTGFPLVRILQGLSVSGSVSNFFFIIVYKVSHFLIFCSNFSCDFLIGNRITLKIYFFQTTQRRNLKNLEEGSNPISPTLPNKTILNYLFSRKSEAPDFSFTKYTFFQSKTKRC